MWSPPRLWPSSCARVSKRGFCRDDGGKNVFLPLTRPLLFIQAKPYSGPVVPGGGFNVLVKNILTMVGCELTGAFGRFGLGKPGALCEICGCCDSVRKYKLVSPVGVVVPDGRGAVLH